MLPAAALGGVKPVIAGAPLATGLTMNVTALEVPPGAGFTTVICTDESGSATSAAVMDISSWLVTELNVVGAHRAVQKARKCFENPVPLMNRVKSALPAVMLSGEIVVRTGVGVGRRVARAIAQEKNAIEGQQGDRSPARTCQAIPPEFISGTPKPLGIRSWEREDNRSVFEIGPAARAIELIAPAAETVNSDSPGAGMVGAAIPSIKSRKPRDELRSARSRRQDAEAIGAPAVCVTSASNSTTVLPVRRPVSLPALSRNFHFLDDLMNAVNDAWIARWRGEGERETRGYEGLYDLPRGRELRARRAGATW